MSGQGQGSQKSSEGLEESWPWSRRTQTQRSPSCQCEFRTMANGAGKWVMWEGLQHFRQPRLPVSRPSHGCFVLFIVQNADSHPGTRHVRADSFYVAPTSYSRVDFYVIKSVVSNVQHTFEALTSPLPTLSPAGCSVTWGPFCWFLSCDTSPLACFSGCAPSVLGSGLMCLPFFCLI